MVTFEEGLRDAYPASAKPFEAMQAGESHHRSNLLDLYRAKFGNHIPHIRRQDVKGFVERRPVWLVRPLVLHGVRKQAEIMELETRRFYERASQQATDVSIRKLLGEIMQPGLAGLMDGSVSTLVPVFAAAFAIKNGWHAFLVGMAASVGAGISIGFAEALSHDGSLTGRGHPWVRRLVCGLMTTPSGIGPTLPFLSRFSHCRWRLWW